MTVYLTCSRLPLLSLPQQMQCLCEVKLLVRGTSLCFWPSFLAALLLADLRPVSAWSLNRPQLCQWWPTTDCGCLALTTTLLTTESLQTALSTGATTRCGRNAPCEVTGLTSSGLPHKTHTF